MAAWRLTDPGLEVERRLEQTYHHAGFSVTITSLTNLLAFLLGIASPYRATRLLCCYAALSVFTAFIFQLTFFGGFLVLLGRAEAANRHGLTLRTVKPLSLADEDGRAYRLCCTGGTDPQNPDDPRDNREHVAMVFCRDVLGSWLSSTLGKILVLLSYVAFLGLAVFGFFRITEGMRLDDNFGQGTYPYRFMELDQRYFYKFAFRYQLIIDHPLDYFDENIQRRSSTIAFEDRFLTNPMYQNYAYDVVFNDDHTEIVASRFFQQIQDVKDFVDFTEITTKLWNTIDSLPLKVMLYHPLMMLVEMHIGAFWMTLKTIIITSFIMIIITFAFLPNLAYSLWVSFAIISTILGTIGFLPFWNVNLNAPTMVTLIISIGFCVDNAAHITYAFGNSKKTTGDSKMRDALYYVGVPIAQACISTMIGVVFLLLTPSYTFHMFAKTICILMAFALYHSIVLLPVLHSLTFSILSKSSSDKTEPKKVRFYKGPDSGVDIPFIDANNT
ncbi:daf-6 [Cordylochernes scorpioides]|uniref:Daf-6 n=1 Tax=Cordylochernes scorpioides TaxID=51811 RepID=A0ABY6JX93_9ARAC|nr:daf-6 [Cordylochernes scorpioides]